MNLKTIDMEIALAEYFNPRVNMMVPNVHWSYFRHELDLLILTKSGYAYEVEIKVSMADLKKDCEKKHGHIDKRIKNLYFAVPEYLMPIAEYIPDRAGIIVVDGNLICRQMRRPVSSEAAKWSKADRYNIARLGTMRIWTLKKRIAKHES